MTYDQMGDPSLAANTLNRILTMDPSDHRAQNTLGYLYAETGERLDEAGELVMSALEAEPSNPAYLDSLGWIRFKQGRYSDAITFLQRAATQDPANVDILDHLGDAYVEAGHQDKAVASWRQALELEPDNDGIQQKVRDLSSAGAGVE
jgi:Flp pilus assembly protein TadD